MKIKKLTIEVDHVPEGPAELGAVIRRASDAIRAGRIPEHVLDAMGGNIGTVTVEWAEEVAPS